jgi:predicted pyridoxine 5'-phosphate oxidase superfamily flavin-nucleotide-binding protein
MTQSSQAHTFGNEGERYVQDVTGTSERASRFHRDQMLDHLNPLMRDFIAQQEMLFIATSDSRGECDSSFRAGPPGFVHVIDDHTVAYPEYRGNGVFASAGNIMENPHIGLMFIDFLRDRIGLHVNGRARILEDDQLRRHVPGLPLPEVPGQRALMWVLVHVEEAYIHCRKHIPKLRKLSADESWGTDDQLRKGGDFFAVKEGNAGPMAPVPGGPEYGDPGYGGPEHNRPTPNTPRHGAPAYSAQEHGGPGYDATGYGGQGYDTPGHGAPGYSGPGYDATGYGGQGYDTPGYGAPTPNTPRHGAPGRHR